MARYTHKTAISNDRLRGWHAGQVSFRVRYPNHRKAGGLASLPAELFIERFYRMCCRPVSSAFVTMV